MPRLAKLLLILGAMLVPAACGGDDEQASDFTVPASPPPGQTETVTLEDVQAAVDGAGVDAIIDRIDEDVAFETDPKPVEQARVTLASGGDDAAATQVLIYADTPSAQAAKPDVEGSDKVESGGAVLQAGPLVAIFAEPPEDGRFQAVWEALRDLGLSAT